MEFDYLHIEDVEDLHDMALRDYGGVPGREKGKLEAKLALPMSGFGDYLEDICINMKIELPCIKNRVAIYFP